MTDSGFRISSFCMEGNCVGAAQDASGMVSVVNTTTPATRVVFTHEEWSAFVAGVKAGEFDHAELPRL